jgi:acetyl/propionyl-CoA carboxylase alpha subunit
MDRISEAIAALRWLCFYRKYVGSRHIEIQVMADSWECAVFIRKNAASSVVKSN